MPISDYFSGNGEKVMKNMAKEYGSEKGKRVFYALANKRDELPEKRIPKPDRYKIRPK